MSDMSEKSSRIPKFFVYLLLVPAVIMIVGIFFSPQIVGLAYFTALLISVAFLIIDKHIGTVLTNYRVTFFLTDIINIIAVAAVLYYEFAKNTLVLNIFLFGLLIVEAAMLVLNIFFTDNKNISKYMGVIVDIVKIGSMVSILAYFYKVSTLWFAIDALLFEAINLGFRIYFAKVQRKEKIQEKTQTEEIEERIHSAGEDEGEPE